MKTYPAVALLGLTALLFWASYASELSEPEASQIIEDPISAPTEVPDSGSSGSDKTALVALYYATNGANWLTNTGWRQTYRSTSGTGCTPTHSAGSSG